MASPLRAVTGIQLIKLLIKDGWIVKRRTNHEVSLAKKFNNRVRVTIIPTKKNQSLPSGTLGSILGPKQTNIGREGLRNLINKYGIK